MFESVRSNGNHKEWIGTFLHTQSDLLHLFLNNSWRTLLQRVEKAMWKKIDFILFFKEKVEIITKWLDGKSRQMSEAHKRVTSHLFLSYADLWPYQWQKQAFGGGYSCPYNLMTANDWSQRQFVAISPYPTPDKTEVQLIRSIRGGGSSFSPHWIPPSPLSDIALSILSRDNKGET